MHKGKCLTVLTPIPVPVVVQDLTLECQRQEDIVQQVIPRLSALSSLRVETLHLDVIGRSLEALRSLRTLDICSETWCAPRQPLSDGQLNFRLPAVLRYYASASCWGRIENVISFSAGTSLTSMS